MGQLLPFTRTLDPDELHRIYEGQPHYELPVEWNDIAVSREPEPMFSLDEVITACLYSAFVGVLVTVGLAYLWAMVL